ncbi:MAG: asparagine synthase (glutamine-hydrolyzing) [Alphaproteobacteria bacterium]
MCGITGLYTFDPRPERTRIAQENKAMCDALSSRGPDSDGQWIDPQSPLALGHRRLSILDLSPAGAQPMSSECGRYVIVFNGEIYNFKQIRDTLAAQGHDQPYKGHSDTEILLRAFVHWSVHKTLESINGMFAFALWDKKAKALYLARDRMGKKPLYIGWSGSTLVFASELKALCAHSTFKRDVNRAALTTFMRFGYVPAPLTIYNDVWQLPAGQMMALDIRMLRAGQDFMPMSEPYWSHKKALLAAQENPVKIDSDNQDSIIEEFENLLGTCVKERMIADVPLGAFLSGGIDSSTIVALMQKHAASPVKTYTIGFENKEYNEAAHAKEIAQHLKTEHHECVLKAKDALDIVPALAEIYDEPFADASAIPTFLVSRFARESVTVALSGDGGDEMLGGYNRHINGAKIWNASQNIPPRLRPILAKIIGTIPPDIWSKARPSAPQFGGHMHKFAEALNAKTQSDLYLSLVSKHKAPKACVIDGFEPRIPLVDPDSQIKEIELKFAEHMMYWDALSYLNGDILTKVDRASMAVGLEARAPLLDRRIYDYVWRLPLNHKIKEGKGKWLLREVLSRHIPKELFERPKQGFSVPIAHWLRTDLKDWAQNLLDQKALKEMGLLDYRYIDKIWQAHQKGQGNHAERLWCVLMFLAWHKKWIG